MREADGRDAEPTACVLDAQSVKTSANVPAAGQGIDAGKKIAGRKRHIGVDTLGLLLAVWVTAASVSDNAGGIHLLSNLAEAHPHITKAWADTDYRAKVIDHGATLGIDVEIARRDAGQKDSRSSLGVGSSSGPSAGSELARRIAHPPGGVSVVRRQPSSKPRKVPDSSAASAKSAKSILAMLRLADTSGNH